MLSIPEPSTITAAAGGLLTASTAYAVPSGDAALAIFLASGLVIGFLWPHAAWRLPVTLALATAAGMALIAAVATMFSMARLVAFAVVVPGPPGLMQAGTSFVASAVALSIVALVTTSLGAWGKEALVHAFTPDTARRVQARMQSGLPDVPADQPTAVPAPAGPPEVDDQSADVVAR